MAETHLPEQFFQYKGSGVIVCGECLDDDLERTKDGRYTGDEAVTMEDVTELPSPDSNAYQCDGCMNQSEGYDEDDDDE